MWIDLKSVPDYYCLWLMGQVRWRLCVSFKLKASQMGSTHGVGCQICLVFSNKTNLFPFNLEKPSIISCGLVLYILGKQNGPLKMDWLTRAESLGFTLWKQSDWFSAHELIGINDRGTSLIPQPCISKYLLEPNRDSAQWVFKHTCPYSPPLLQAMSGIQVVNQILQWLIHVPASEA